jgi:hypothetical protein
VWFGDKYAEKGPDGQFTGKLLSLSGTEFENAGFKTLNDENYDDMLCPTAITSAP